MRTTSVLLLLNNKTRKLYTFALTTNRHNGSEQEMKGASRPTPCYAIAGAFCQWTYFVVISFSV
jgi:hypothetical protein